MALTSRIISVHQTGPSSVKVVEAHRDNAGLELQYVSSQALGSDYNAALIARQAEIEQEFTRKEAQQIADRVLNGEDGVALVFAPHEHAGTAAILRVLIRKAVTDDDIRPMYRIRALMTHIFANYTDAEVRAFLNITQAILNLIRSRHNAVLAIAAGIPAASVTVDL